MIDPFSLRVTTASRLSPATRAKRQFEIVGLVERLHLVLVGEDDVDGAGAHQFQELVAVAADAERIGQRHRHFAAVGVRDRARTARMASLARGGSQR